MVKITTKNCNSLICTKDHKIRNIVDNENILEMTSINNGLTIGSQVATTIYPIYGDKYIESEKGIILLNIFPDDIVSIEDYGNHQSWDIEVEDVHRYIANGIEVSNSRRGALISIIDCFSENTEILTSSGWIAILDVIKRVGLGEKLYAIDKEGKSNLIYDPIVKEPSEIYQIETENGAILECTADHRLEVRNILTKKIYLKAIKDIDIDCEEILTIGFEGN